MQRSPAGRPNLTEQLSQASQHRPGGAKRTLIAAALLLLILLQVVSAVVGLHVYLGVLGTVIALLVAVVVNLGLAVVIGNFLCATFVWGWHWIPASLFAMTGLIFLFPPLVQQYFQRYLGRP